MTIDRCSARDDIDSLRGFDAAGREVTRAFDGDRRQFMTAPRLTAAEERHAFELLIDAELEMFVQLAELPNASALWDAWRVSEAANLLIVPIEDFGIVVGACRSGRASDIEGRCNQLERVGLPRYHRALFLRYALEESVPVQVTIGRRYQRLLDLKKRIIESNIPLAIRRRMGGVSPAHSLLLGLIGLADAIDRFSLSRGRFATYADQWILARISRGSVMGDGGFREPGSFNGRRLKVRSALRQRRRDGEEPTIEELCAAVPGLEPGSLPALVLGSGRWARALGPGTAGISRTAELISLNIVDDPLRAREAAAAWQRFESALVSLTERERLVLRARVGLETGKRRTLRDVGCELGVSRERVRQIQNEAFYKVLRSLGADPAEAGDLLGGDEDGE